MLQARKLSGDLLSSLCTSTEEVTLLILERRRNGGFIQPVQCDAHTNGFFLLLSNSCSYSSCAFMAKLHGQDFLPMAQPVALSIKPSWQEFSLQPPLPWNSPISCCLHPLLACSIQSSKERRYWVVCYGDKRKQNEKNPNQLIKMARQCLIKEFLY